MSNSRVDSMWRDMMRDRGQPKSYSHPSGPIFDQLFCLATTLRNMLIADWMIGLTTASEVVEDLLYYEDLTYALACLFQGNPAEGKPHSTDITDGPMIRAGQIIPADNALWKVACAANERYRTAKETDPDRCDEEYKALLVAINNYWDSFAVQSTVPDPCTKGK